MASTSPTQGTEIQTIIAEDLNNDSGEFTVTVNVDVEESTVDGQEDSSATDGLSDSADFGVTSMQKSPVSQRLLQHTHATLQSMKDLDDQRGRVKHEDDIWWDQRGSKAYSVPRGSMNKALAHVTSKLHVPTAATIFWQREKANTEKIRPKPVPRLANPESINPHINVKSRFQTAVTKAAHSGEWKAWKDKLKEDELKVEAELTAKNAELKKVKHTSERLLCMASNKQAHKFTKDVDPREAGWKRVPVAATHVTPLDLALQKIAIDEGHDEASSPGGTSRANRSCMSSVNGSPSKTERSLKRSNSFEILSSQQPAYKQWVPRAKSPTPVAFGSGSARAVTPTEVKRRSSTPNGTASTPRSGSAGATRRMSSGSSIGSASPGATPFSATPKGASNSMSRAAEARQRVTQRDRSSPPTTPVITPFDQVMQQNRYPSSQATSNGNLTSAFAVASSPAFASAMEESMAESSPSAEAEMF